MQIKFYKNISTLQRIISMPILSDPNVRIEGGVRVKTSIRDKKSTEGKRMKKGDRGEGGDMSSKVR